MLVCGGQCILTGLKSQKVGFTTLIHFSLVVEKENDLTRYLAAYICNTAGMRELKILNW